MDYLLSVLTLIGIYVILAVSLNLIVGFAGIPAFGHMAPACVGAYTSALVVLHAGMSPWLGVLLGSLMGALLGVLTGLLGSRLKEDYLAIATFGVGLIVYSVVKNWVALTRGPMGLGGIPALFRDNLFQTAATTDFLIVVVTCPSFCTSSSERVYITARGCELGLGGARGL